ncbi:MAG: DUF3054 domain-containing protein [Chloroflexi bacterium]|nr:DUF3054 domain-containing protein [Chloroflexota bacterium]MCY3958859.1 DUF3054 domain-containing protein [Chloroflexota bacterium]
MTDRKRALVALTALGDALVFVLFVALTPIEHGSVEIAAFGRTALPFAAVWFFGSPWLGAFRTSTLTRLRIAAWRVPLIWLGCGILAVMLRVWLTDRTFSWAFTIASISLVAALLVVWRIALILAARRITRRPRRSPPA